MGFSGQVQGKASGCRGAGICKCKMKTGLKLSCHLLAVTVSKSFHGFQSLL